MVNQRKVDRNHGRQDVRYALRRFFAGKQRCPWFEKMLIEAGYRKDKKLLQSMDRMKNICADLRGQVVKVAIKDLAKSDLTLDKLMEGKSYG